MSALPYLHDSEPDMGRRAVEIESETFPLSYLHLDEEDDFEDLREMACDPENIMPPSDVRITWQLVNGWEYIYNTEKSRCHTSTLLSSRRAKLLTHWC